MFDELLSQITNIGVFTGSLRTFASTLSVSKVVMCILVFFMLVGLVDKMRGNKRGYGEKFDEGFMAMGPLALAVVGIVALSPVLMGVLAPIVTPLYSLVGASPAMFPSILALDMGGYALATQMAGADVAIGQYSGIIVASMLGITICFTIPYSLQVMKTSQDRAILAMGILVGIITLPVGCLLGGLLMRFTGTPLPIGRLLLNTLPVLVLAAVVALGFALNQRLTLRVFSGFSKGLTAVINLAPGIAIFQYLTGIRLPLFNLMVDEDPILGGVPLEVGLLLVGLIAIVLCGAFPMILFLNRSLAKPMARFGQRTGINSQASTGLLTQLASSIPVLSVLDSMDARGKLLNIAFAVSGSFALGDVLAFTGGASPEMVFPVVVGKLAAGVLALALALFLLRRGVLKPEAAGEQAAPPVDAS